MTPARPLRVLSCGAGVQTTMLALAIRDGLVEPIDAAVFADTGWEPPSVYRHLWANLVPLFAELGVPLIVNSKGNIREDALDPSHRFASMPLFVRNVTEERVVTRWETCGSCAGQGFYELDVDVEDPTCATCEGAGSVGVEWEVRERVKPGMMRRQCTNEYKLRAIRQVTWRLHRDAGRPGVVSLIGISADEVERMRDSDVGYIEHSYPLVELGWTRDRCHAELAARGWTAPRSACIGCPFHTDEEWLRMALDEPEAIEDAIAFDEAIRGGNVRLLNNRQVELRGSAYLHRRRIPLREVISDLMATGTEAPRPAQGRLDLVEEGWSGECVGMCGT